VIAGLVKREARRSPLRSAAAVMAAVLIGCAPGAGGASPATSLGPMAEILTYKGNAARTTEHPGPGPADAPTSIWRFEHTSLFRTFPLVVDGKIVAGAEDGTLFVLDAASGATRDLKIAGGFRATGTIADGTLYVASLDGRLNTIKLAGLEAGWSVDGVHPESFITLADDLVIAGAQDALVAYARADGKEAWRLEVAGAERMGLGGGVVYASGRESGTLTAVGLDGVERWQFDTGAGEVLTTVVGRDVVYVATRGAAGGGSTVSALDLEGIERWRAELDGKIGAHGFNVARVYVTIEEDPSSLIALDSSTGNVQWRHDFDGLTVSVPAIAGGRIYIVSQVEGLVALDASSGDVAWEVELGEVARAGLAISGGLVFVTTEDFNGHGRVLAFR
jgi:outer membrane protein assembly factor BamB